jgi:2-oxoglutarate ferredoxin oxidoreductase subunit delta
MPEEEGKNMEIKAPSKAKGTVFIDAERCKGCGFCVEFCPTYCLDLSDEFNSKGYHPPILGRPEDCTGCDLCGMYCPDFAIYSIMFKKLKAS